LKQTEPKQWEERPAKAGHAPERNPVTVQDANFFLPRHHCRANISNCRLGSVAEFAETMRLKLRLDHAFVFDYILMSVLSGICRLLDGIERYYG
jgi:hypothetical protein